MYSLPERIAVCLLVRGDSIDWLKDMPLISMCGNPNKSLSKQHTINYYTHYRI